MMTMKFGAIEMETFGKPLTLRQISCSELEDKFFSRSWSALNTMGGQIKL